MTANEQTSLVTADMLLRGRTIVTMNEQRQTITDGALAVDKDRIVAVGKSSDLEKKVNAAYIIEGSRFVITPGFIDAHIHQLVWSADGRGVRGFDNYQCTLIDEEQRYTQAQQAGADIVKRFGVPNTCAWPVN